jgi:hypothetical protein
MIALFRRIGFHICLLSALTAPSFSAASNRADPARHFDVGIDQSNMIWESKPKQASIFAGIHKIGARWFRDAFSFPAGRIPEFVDVVRQAKQANLKVLVVIMQDASDYDGADAKAENAGFAFRLRCGWWSGSLKLSRIDLAKFKTRLSALLTALKAAKLDVDAFEIGNEDDWVCFNGDVPFGRPATPQDISIAARGYARFLEAAADTIHDRHFFPEAKIITFGMSHADSGWDENPPHHLPNPAAFVASLRNLDGKNYLDNARYHIDGYGSHIYPEADDIERSTMATLAKDTAALGPHLPVWITEFGLRKKQFPNRKGQSRAQAIETFFDTLAADTHTAVGPVFYYNYADPSWGLIDAQGNLLPAAAALGREQHLCGMKIC